MANTSGQRRQLSPSASLLDTNVGDPPVRWPRRSVLCGAIGALAGGVFSPRTTRFDAATLTLPRERAQIAITLDLEMSRDYPQRGMMDWDYDKGNLDSPTKRYAVEAARVVEKFGGRIHFFCVGRVLEQPDVEWLKGLAAAGHPVGNHTYDHVNVLARSADDIQFRFRRAPWLIAGKPVEQVLRENIATTTVALRERCGIEPAGFRTPGGFARGLHDRVDIQRLLLDLGFRWCSSLYPTHSIGSPRQEPTEEIYRQIVTAQSAAQPFQYPSGLIEIPMSPVSDVNAFRSNYWKLDWFLTALRRAVEWAIEHRAVFDFLAHPSCLVVEDPEFQSIRLICELVKQAGERAELVGLDSIANRIAE